LESYADALQLTVIALGVLLLVSFCFVGVTRGLQWFIEAGGRRGRAGRRDGTKKVNKDKKDVIIAAAVAGYLQAEQERKL
jgi:hypothetical protein